ncbi:alpha/beta hydrolase [Paramicrobacterium agarici]|uniref:alpha/beta hydrolase n=1 Tax=Paramicrobacterium agarici TaxID=630514 RepID=UPI00115032A1|nr:alpha/beta hydrolase [Microbacterium agarici]TQO23749.1 alpha/beta hydrolase family protein [Microbacterium agarici]
MRKNRTRRLAVVAFAAALVMPLSGCFTAFIPPNDGSSSSPTSKPQPTTTGTTADEFYAQDIEWSTDACPSNFECATVRAPMNWDEPEAGEVELALIRSKAQGDAIGSLLLNPGGPGGSGFDFVKDSLDYAVDADLRENFDIVGFDPRGVGRSTAVKCYEPEQMDEYLYGIPENTDTGSEAWIDEMTESATDFGQACLDNTGPMLEFITTVQAAKDLDLLRAVLGDDELYYLGYSYGTFLGATYAELFPDNVGRLVLDGAIDPSTSNFEVSKAQAKGFEGALSAFLEDCIDNNSDCAFSGSVDSARDTIVDLIASVGESPLKGPDGRMLGSSTLITAIILPLYSPGNWEYLNLMLSDVMKGDAANAFFFADQYNGRKDDGTYADNSTEAFMAYNCRDYTYNADPETMRDQAEEIESVAPVFGPYMGYGDIGCANWPFTDGAERTEIHAPGADPILVVGTTGDPATPYEWAENLAEQLDSGRLVTYEGEGHTAYNKGSQCVNDVVDDYLINGTVPDEDPMCT